MKKVFICINIIACALCCACSATPKQPDKASKKVQQKTTKKTSKKKQKKRKKETSKPADKSIAKKHVEQKWVVDQAEVPAWNEKIEHKATRTIVVYECDGIEYNTYTEAQAACDKLNEGVPFDERKAVNQLDRQEPYTWVEVIEHKKIPEQGHWEAT